MPLTPERKQEINDLLLAYLLIKLGPSNVFPHGMGEMAREMQVAREELQEFLQPYLRKYFHPIGE